VDFSAEQHPPPYGTEVRSEGGHAMTYALASQQVSWLTVHDFAAPRLRRVGDWPMAGSPVWCELGDRDPDKWASVLDAAQHFALRIETCQQALCGASRAISAAEDWLAVARIAKCRGEFYSARPWLSRGASV
jgi:hypothetical protein